MQFSPLKSILKGWVKLRFYLEDTYNDAYSEVVKAEEAQQEAEAKALMEQDAALSAAFEADEHDEYEDIPDPDEAFYSSLTRRFDAAAFKRNLYRFALEHDVYYVSIEAFHSLLVNLEDVSKYLEYNRLNPKDLSDSLKRIYLNAAHKGSYDKYHPTHKKEADNRAQAMKRHKDDPGIFPEPDDIEQTRPFPKYTPLDKLAYDQDKTPGELLNAFMGKARMEGTHSVHLMMINDAAKITGERLTQVEFFKSVIRKAATDNALPRIYEYTKLMTKNKYKDLIPNPEMF